VSMIQDKYKVEKYKFEELKNIVELPKFQRSFVWTAKKQESFIESIKSGLPIGMFLLYKKPGEEKFSIIDGRQRMTTLIQFERGAFKFYKRSEVSIDLVDKFFNSNEDIYSQFSRLNLLGQQAFIEEIIEILFSKINSRQLTEESSIKFDIVNEILKRIPITQASEKYVQNFVIKYIDDLVSSYDLSNLYIPAIEFTGNIDEVVNTFVNLNTMGTKLSKYDIFSAKWIKYTKKIDDPEIKLEIFNKYKDALDKGIEIEDFDPNNIEFDEEINIFEYTYALSKILGKKAPKLVSTSDKYSDIDSLAFSILGGIFNIKNKDMEELGGVLDKSKLDLVHLKEKIINSATQVEQMLEKYLVSPSKDKKIFRVLPEFMVSSLIVTHFKLSNEISSGKLNSIKSDVFKRSSFVKYAKKHVLNDILRGYWSGAGDSKLDELNETAINSRYFKDVPEESFRFTLEEWFNENAFKKTVTQEVKFVLNFLFAETYKPLNTENFDYDHIIPQNRFPKLNREKYDINNPLNLCIIYEFDNRSKRNMTYYELSFLRQSLVQIDEDKLMLFNYPSREELSFLETDSTIDIDKFNEFLSSRRNLITAKYIKLLYGK